MSVSHCLGCLLQVWELRTGKVIKHSDKALHGDVCNVVKGGRHIALAGKEEQGTVCNLGTGRSAHYFAAVIVR